MKRVVVVIAIFIALIILGFLSPWNNFRLSFSQLLGLGSIEEKAGVKVFSLVGEMEIYIDNEFQGTVTPESSPFEVLDLTPDFHQIRLKRKSTPDQAYFEFNRTIKFEKGLDVTISYELGPTTEFSEGHVFYAEERFDNSSTKLNVLSTPEGASLYLDDNFIGETPISNVDIDLNAQHKIKLEKAGYDTIEFNILPESQEERDKLKGYNLHLDINMFLVPINIIDNQPN